MSNDINNEVAILNTFIGKRFKTKKDIVLTYPTINSIKLLH